VVVIAGAPAAPERTSGFLLHHQARTVDTQLARKSPAIRRC
jgi:indolepyruvate decarboxylase